MTSWISRLEYGNRHYLRVTKAAGRTDAVGRAIEFVVNGGRLEVLRHETEELTQTGGSLKAQRKAKGISQAELARRLGITPSALSQAQAGLRGLSEETLKSAYAVLGTDLKPPELPPGAPPGPALPQARRGSPCRGRPGGPIPDVGSHP